MNIVVVGAGSIGKHIAELLSRKGHRVVLVDNSLQTLNEVSQSLDVAIRHGSGTDWQLLEALQEMDPDIIFALTQDDETNLVVSSIAKSLGYPKTCARVRSDLYLKASRLDISRLFHVDYLIAPEVLLAYDVFSYIMGGGAIEVKNFSHGAVQMRSLKIPTTWKQDTISLSKLDLPKNIVAGFIKRELDGQKRKNSTKYIFPHGDDCILAGDELTLIGERQAMSQAEQFFRFEKQRAKHVAIVGGTLIGRNVAKLLLAEEIAVTLIEKDYSLCCRLAEDFPNANILHHDATDLEFLEAERISQVDYFFAATRQDEVNILLASHLQAMGCKETLLSLLNMSYLSAVKNLGIRHAVSPRMTAASSVLTIINSETASSIVSLYDDAAEIMEVRISPESKIVGIPIAKLALHLPRDFLFAVIQNRGKILIANGERVLSPGDTVIVISAPRHIEDLRELF